jgi:hypothetical protein
MKKKILVLIIGLLLMWANAYAENGDFIVEGNVGIGTDAPNDKLHVVGDITLGDGTDTSRYIKFDRSVTDHMFGYDNTIGAWNSTAFYLSDSIYIDKTSNFSGYFLGPNGAYGGFVKKNGYPLPLILSDTVFLGTDSSGVSLAWDTNRDGQWAYCEGVTYDTGLINCADYESLMAQYDIYWVWKHGGWSNHPESFDFKFLFDGESNDGIMGFMEDEDAFYFDEKLGIGTTTPDSKLHVVGDGHFTGDLTVDGNIAAKYQDLAEYVKTSKTLTSGTVVMIDLENDNQVLPSDKEYNTLVAGVVSQMPGIILGEGGADKAQIAHTGRVKVKVDTSNGAISRGDLLVTSPVKGHAMRSEPVDIAGVSIHRPGTIIGKALEPLTEGQQGEILVLLTLQ